MAIQGQIKLVQIIDNCEYEVVAGTLLENDHLIYEDKFGRKWKLTPIQNSAILMPFKIEPLLTDPLQKQL